MVLLGWVFGKEDVEIVEVPSTGSPACLKPADNPFIPSQSSQSVGGFVEGRPLVCGGDHIKSCSEYSFDSKTWNLTTFSMNEKRQSAEAVVLPNGTFLVLGGRLGDNSLTTTELLIDNDRFEYGVDLPGHFERFCAVMVDESTVLIAGGYYLKEQAHLLEVHTGIWTRTGDLTTGRYGHSCGLVGETVVAVSGYTVSTTTYPYGPTESIDILSLATLTWSPGKLAKK